MTTEGTDEKKAGRLRVKCKHCESEGVLDFGEWAFRITGAVEAVCPGCGKKTVYVGQFGFSVDAERQLADIRRSGISVDTEGSTP